MYRNIPILSFIIQLGKCFNCKKRISIQYPLVEFVTGFLWFWFIYTIPQEPNIEIIIKTIFSIIMVSYLIPLAIIDSKHLYFPFTLIIPLIILSISSLILNYFFSFEWFESLMGLTFAVTFLGTVYFIAKVWLKFKGREEDPMGFGDILLIIPLGIWLGPLNILLCFLISSILALLTWIILHFLINYEFKAKMPFGPYLIISSIIIKFLNLNII